MLVCLLTAAIVDAEPMNLNDGQSRWIGVRFEVSPDGRPGQRDTVYSQRFPAWLEAGDRPGLVRVSVDSAIVEEHLMGSQRPVPGSFSDFVWLFDAATGEVVSASLNGKLVRELRWGLFRSTVETRIEVDMSTSQQAGYEMPRRLFRNTIFPYCGAGTEPGDGCTLVTPSRYQPRSGYVNAVGHLAVRSRIVTLHTFSPLGEAIFSELVDLPEAEFELTGPRPSLEAAPALDGIATTLLQEASR